jgi:hypothetical protein
MENLISMTAFSRRLISLVLLDDNTRPPHTMNDPHNDEVLSHAEFWDGRYAVAVADTEGEDKADGTDKPNKSVAGNDVPTHEWFRSYSDLEPFFAKVLFERPGCRPDDNPSVLHLGCGDSVRPRPTYSVELSLSNNNVGHPR